MREEAELLSQVRKFKPQNCMTCLDSHTEVFFAQEGFASATSDYATRAFLLYHLLREKAALLRWISKCESSMVYLDALLLSLGGFVSDQTMILYVFSALVHTNIFHVASH